MNLIQRIYPAFSILFLLITLSSCDQGIQEPEETGELKMSVTDAPVDDAEVQGVFVTVTEIRVDGESYSGFTGKQTIDLMAYQHGDTYLLGNEELKAGTYNELTLVLDLDSDADGNSPGCYVMTQDGRRENLANNISGTMELDVSKNFQVTANNTTELVVDVDLRKAIRYEGDDNVSNRNYQFATQSDLNASLRAVSQEEASTVTGNFEAGAFTNPDKVVVYLYEEGTFDRDQEEVEADTDVRFQGALTSSLAAESNGSFSYELNFIEPGDYEVVLVVLEEESNGSTAFSGFLQTSFSLNGAVTSAVTVEAGFSATLDLTIWGLIN